MRRLRRLIAARHRTRFNRAQAETSIRAGGDTAEAVEVGIERLVLLKILRMVITAGGVGLPHLDHRVGDRRAVAVEHAPLDRDAFPSRAARRQVIPYFVPYLVPYLVPYFVPSFAQQRAMKKWADGLRR